MKKITLLFIAFVKFTFVIAQPTINAPNPTNIPSNVISIYGGSFTSVATNYNPFWGQSGGVNTNYDPGTGNLVMAYTNFNYQGTELATQNASGMEYLHIDIWTANATVIKVSPINNGTGAGEFLVNVPLVTNGWSSVDLPKSAFTGMTWDSVFQLKFDGQGGVNPSTIYLDNIYFWKTPVASGTDATLSDLKVNGTTINGFTPSAANYTYQLVVGTTLIPQITSATTTDSSATVTSITQASAIPGTASVLVTSQNGNVTKTYTVLFVADLPNPSPTPSTPNAEVLNIYSDTGGFTNTWTPNYTFGGFASKPDLDLGPGVNEAIKMNFAAQGYGEGTNGVTNISAYNWVHFDYFADAESTQIRFILIKNNSGAVSEHVYELTTAGSNGTLVQGSWRSVNVPLSFFEGIGFNKAQFFQYKLGTTSDLVSKIVYFDNIYFSMNQGTILNTNSFVKSSLRMYPNPVNNILNLSCDSIIDNIEVYNTLGQMVSKQSSNSNEATVNISSLSNGIYILTAQVGNELVRKQFIKE